jgi:RNA polymerase sigma-70 factor (sigma-E family)
VSRLSADEESYDAFVTARYAALRRTAYVLTGNHHDAEDLLQTALIKAAGVWGRISARPEPYVRKIMYHENVSRRRRRRVYEEPLGAYDVVRDDDSDRAWERLTLADALARLTPKQRTVLVLRYYEDLTETQAAAVMGVRPGTIKSQTRHALMRLRQVAPDLLARADPVPEGAES